MVSMPSVLYGGVVAGSITAFGGTKAKLHGPMVATVDTAVPEGLYTATLSTSVSSVHVAVATVVTSSLTPVAVPVHESSAMVMFETTMSVKPDFTTWVRALTATRGGAGCLRGRGEDAARVARA